MPKAITEKWLLEGDLLINSTGEGTLGRTAQVWFPPRNLTVDSHITIVRPISSIFNYYIGFWGITHEAELEALHVGSTGQTELPRERIRSMHIVEPDSNTLMQFNNVVSPMVKTIVANQEEIRLLISLRNSLMARLMSGDLDVSGVDI